MPTLDDARSLVLTPASDLTSRDLISYFHAASNSTRTALVGSLTGHNLSSSVVVDPSGTDLQRGTALVAAYAAAKLLTPNGAALSANNRAVVVIPVGRYKLTSSLVLDTDFIDLVAQVPAKPARRLSTDDDPETPANTSHCRPGPTEIYTDIDKVSTVKQTCDDVRLSGFSITQLCLTGTVYDLPEWGAFLVGQGSANAPSLYQDMYFWCATANLFSSGGVRAYTNFSGTWINCIANSASFRLGWGVGGTETATFSAKMYDCEAGAFSYVGDFPNPESRLNYTVQNARFERCKALGTVWTDPGNGVASFAGCSGAGAAVEATSYFVDCEAGDKSFGIGAVNQGNYIRCRAGVESFGANSASVTDIADFAGYAEDCVAGARSFGGANGANLGRLSGTLVRCTGTGNTVSTRLEGATIRDCRFTATTTGVHLFTLIDSNSSISNSELIVLQGGTGIPIYAATAKNVVAAHNRMNNASNDADGLGANVTNLVTGNNVVSNSIR